MKEIYQAADITQAEREKFQRKWDVKYPDISKAWEKKRLDRLTDFMGFSEHIRRS